MTIDAPLFEKYVPALGRLRLRPLDLPQDTPLIHDWVNRDYASYWGLQGLSLEAVADEYHGICRRADVYMGYCGDQPAFLMEAYDPRQDPIGEHYACQPGDRGMHILVAPAERPVSGFTWEMFSFVMDFLFSDARVQRVVVEPDVRNRKIHILNTRAGFQQQKVVELPNKTAHLEFCTREQYRAALDREQHGLRYTLAAQPQRAAEHLHPDNWDKVNRLLLCKAVSEFAHELLIEPEQQGSEDGWGHYRLGTDDPAVEYRFRAQVLSLEHWYLDKASLQKTAAGADAPLDALAFIHEVGSRLALAEDVLPTYLEEISSTLYASAYKHQRRAASAWELVHADLQTVETAMLEGHPAFLANSGRIGFDALDYRAYAPEAASPLRLVWLAAHKSRAQCACGEDLTYESLLEQELGPDCLARFRNQLEQQGLDSGDYWLMPVHPWQWFNKLTVVFAADIAARRLVCLGYGEDFYLAQQSIRTFFNISHPGKRYVKTALSILNMGFMRGLSPYYMSTTPAINDYLHRLIDNDPYLAERGFGILREVAAIGYRNAPYEAAIVQDSPYKKMLAALWRESPIPRLQPGQQVMTMAAFLHVDCDGTALLPELIKASGLETEAWLQRYLDCYLSPLLHCFYAYDLVFMPHGENLIMVLENHVPVGAFMKDIAEEAAIMNHQLVLSDKVQRLAVKVPDHLKTLSIFTDFFDLIFRYMGHILLEHSGFAEQRFWGLIADCVLDYQQQHPQLADKFERYDLFAPEFIRSCLNRLQINNNRQMIDLADPAKNLQFVGTLLNPIAPFRPH